MTNARGHAESMENVSLCHSPEPARPRPQRQSCHDPQQCRGEVSTVIMRVTLHAHPSPQGGDSTAARGRCC